MAGWLESIANTAANFYMQKDAQAFNAKMQKDQQNFAQSMFDQTNAYNSPSNQKKLLEEAGLNTNLAYGNGVLGNMAASATSPGGSASSGQGSGAFRLMNKQERAAIESQIETSNANIELIEANADKARAEAEEIRGWKRENYESSTNLNKKRIEEIGSNIGKQDAETAKIYNEIEWGKVHARLMEMQTEGFRLDNMFKEATMQTRIDQLAADLNLSQAQARLVPLLLAAQIDNVKADSLLKNAQTGLTRAEINEVINKTNLLYQQIQGQQLSNEGQKISNEVNRHVGSHEANLADMKNNYGSLLLESIRDWIRIF